MHENARIVRVAAPVARANDFTTSRLQKVSSAAASGRLSPISPRTTGRALIVDLTDGPLLPSLAVGVAAAALRARGDEVRVAVPERAADPSQAFSRIATNAERSIVRSALVGHGFGARGFVARTLSALAGAGRRDRERAAAVREIAAMRVAGEVVLVASDEPVAALAGELAAGIAVADAATAIVGLAQPPVADFTDYPVARLRVLPIAACHRDGRPRSADFVEHDVREYARRYGNPDLVFVDRAMNASAADFRAIVEGMQRNAPGVRWIARAEVRADGGDDGLSRRDLRDAAASGLRRLTVSLDAAVVDDGAFARLAQVVRDATAAGIGVLVESLVDTAAASPAEVASAAGFLADNAGSIDRVQFGAVRPGAAALASLRALVDAAEAINALPVRNPAPSFDLVR